MQKVQQMLLTQMFGTLVAIETEPIFREDEWILKGTSDVRANPFQINQSGQRRL